MSDDFVLKTSEEMSFLKNFIEELERFTSRLEADVHHWADLAEHAYRHYCDSEMVDCMLCTSLEMHFPNGRRLP